MKRARKISALLVISLLLTVAGVAVTPASEIPANSIAYVAQLNPVEKCLPVFKGPSEDFDKVACLRRCERVTLTGLEVDGWVEILAPYKGWLQGLFLDPNSAICSSGSTSTVTEVVVGDAPEAYFTWWRAYPWWRTWWWRHRHHHHHPFHHVGGPYGPRINGGPGPRVIVDRFPGSRVAGPGPRINRVPGRRVIVDRFPGNRVTGVGPRLNNGQPGPRVSARQPGPRVNSGKNNSAPRQTGISRPYGSARTVIASHGPTTRSNRGAGFNGGQERHR